MKELVLKNLTIVKVWNYYVFDKLEVPNSVIASILTPNFFSYKVGNCALEMNTNDIISRIQDATNWLRDTISQHPTLFP